MNLATAVTAYAEIVCKLTASEAHEVESVRAAKIIEGVTSGRSVLDVRIEALRFATGYAESIIWGRI